MSHRTVFLGARIRVISIEVLPELLDEKITSENGVYTFFWRYISHRLSLYLLGPVHLSESQSRDVEATIIWEFSNSR